MSFRIRIESRPLAPTQKRPRSGKMRRPAVALPAELLNEPYSYDDNGDRPEKKIFRSDFIFITYPCGAASCSIGQDEVDTPGPEYVIGSRPKKRSSYFSIVNIYDTYGLDITLSYLDWLQSDRNKPGTVWLATYLRGSLAVLDPVSLKIETSVDVSHLSLVEWSLPSSLMTATSRVVWSPSLTLQSSHWRSLHESSTAHEYRRHSQLLFGVCAVRCLLSCANWSPRIITRLRYTSEVRIAVLG